MHGKQMLYHWSIPSAHIPSFAIALMLPHKVIFLQQFIIVPSGDHKLLSPWNLNRLFELTEAQHDYFDVRDDFYFMTSQMVPLNLDLWSLKSRISILYDMVILKDLSHHSFFFFLHFSLFIVSLDFLLFSPLIRDLKEKSENMSTSQSVYLVPYFSSLSLNQTDGWPYIQIPRGRRSWNSPN